LKAAAIVAVPASRPKRVRRRRSIANGLAGGRRRRGDADHGVASVRGTFNCEYTPHVNTCSILHSIG
jgi:hypothetical protein